MIRPWAAALACSFGIATSTAIADKLPPPPIPLDCRFVQEADIREECLRELPNGEPNGVWNTKREFASGWTLRRVVFMAGPGQAGVLYEWAGEAAYWSLRGFARPTLRFSCILPPNGRPDMTFGYSHEWIGRAATYPRRDKLHITLDGIDAQVIEFPHGRSVWATLGATETQNVLRLLAGHIEAVLAQHIVSEGWRDKSAYAAFDLAPLKQIRELVHEKCRW